MAPPQMIPSPTSPMKRVTNSWSSLNRFLLLLQYPKLIYKLSSELTFWNTLFQVLTTKLWNQHGQTMSMLTSQMLLLPTKFLTKLTGLFGLNNQVLPQYLSVSLLTNPLRPLNLLMITLLLLENHHLTSLTIPLTTPTCRLYFYLSY